MSQRRTSVCPQGPLVLAGLFAFALLAVAPLALGQDEESAPADSKQIIHDIEKGEELALSGKGGYNYDPAGRRDPFVNPLKARREATDGEVRPEGWPGMLINEVRLQGITVFGPDPIAVFLGTDDVGYFKREGDELWDGKIERIDFDERLVVFEQKVDDPSSPIRFRKVERKLHAPETLTVR